MDPILRVIFFFVLFLPFTFVNHSSKDGTEIIKKASTMTSEWEEWEIGRVK